MELFEYILRDVRSRKGDFGACIDLADLVTRPALNVILIISTLSLFMTLYLKAPEGP